MSDKSPFIAELKRRKVFRVAGVYAIVAWLVIQVGESTFEALHLPPWALTLIIVMLFTGFPIAIIFAWIFDKSPEGKIELDKQDQNLRPLVKRKRTWFALGGIAAGIIVGVFFAQFYSPDTKDNDSMNDKSVAVLPFTTFSADDEDNSFFADGVHDDILTQLSKIRDIKVISRTSVVQYKNTTKTMRQIADELNVKHVLEGSVRRAGNQIRIVAQLIKADTDNHIWSETYDREYADIFAIQSDVAKQIATALKATLTPEESDYIDEIPTDNMEAYDYFLKGKHFWDTYATKEGNQKAVDMFDKAIELDPNFTLAYVWASITHSSLYNYFTWDHTQERKELARSTLNMAIALDPDHPQVHFAEGMYQSSLNNIQFALREFEIAFEGEPNNGEIASYVGYAHKSLGNWEQAEKALLKAYELNPLNLFIPRDLGAFYRNQRKFQKADNYFNFAVQIDPEQAHIYSWMAFNYVLGFGDIDHVRSLLKEAELNVKSPQGLLYAQCVIEIYARDFAKALRYATEHMKHSPESILLGYTYHSLGQEELAQAEFDSLRIYWEEKVLEEPENSFSHSTLGVIYAYLGLKEKAIAEGQRGIALLPIATNHKAGPNRIRSLAFIYLLTGEYDLAIEYFEYLLSIPSLVTKWGLRLDPIYDPLRENPRFQKLIAED